MCWVCLFLICLGSHLPCCSFACFSFALRCVASHLSVSHLPCFSFAYAPLSCLEPATCPALCMLWIMRTLNAVLIRFVGKQVGGGVLTWGVRRGINFLISGDGQLLNWRKCSPFPPPCFCFQSCRIVQTVRMHFMQGTSFVHFMEWMQCLHQMLHAVTHNVLTCKHCFSVDFNCCM